MGGLNDKQERFCEEYMIDLNATQAAIRAGYSPGTANEQAARLLVNVSIRNELDRLKANFSRRAGANAERVVRELGVIAFSTSEETRDRLKALELLGKHIGVFDKGKAAQTNVETKDPLSLALERTAKELDAHE